MQLSIIGIDLGKTSCSLVGVDTAGKVLVRRRMRRDTIVAFCSKYPGSVVAMEACCGAHHIGRALAAKGHEIRLMSPEYVRPYVEAQKNDDRDAEAIAEAASRPTMRFVTLKSEEQLDMQTLHRVRDRLVGDRTSLMNQMRSLLLERGHIVAQGRARLAVALAELLDGKERVLATRIHELIADMRRQWVALDERIKAFDAEFAAAAKAQDGAKRLLSIPGIGALNATALVAAVGDAGTFARGRDLAAWLGLVPRQVTTGGRPKLLGITNTTLAFRGTRQCPCGFHAWLCRRGGFAMDVDADWRIDLDRWLEPFLTGLNHAARRSMCPLYIAGLIGLGERKSMQPMAARQDGVSYDRLQHFISVGRWDDAPLARTLLAEADRLVGGHDAMLVIDDTSLPKKGQHSVGVAPQYLSTQGRTGNCQALVSLTLARREVPVLVGLRLFLPVSWTDDVARMERAGVPETARAPRTKLEIALDEVDRVRAAGGRFGLVLADAGYGGSAEFLAGLSARGLAWAAGVRSNLKVYPADVKLRPADPKPGRPPDFLLPDKVSEPAEAVLARAKWRSVTWRSGTKGPLKVRFAALRVRVADGSTRRIGGKANQHLPGDKEVWLVGEHRTSGERKFYLSNLPPKASLRRLASAIKARWVCEQAHQQVKEELGLDHFEGRSWTGLHRHALMTMLAYAFLQHRRLATAGWGK